MHVQLISEGSSKLSSVPSGGGGGAAPSAGGAAAGGAAAAEEKKEEKVEEKVCATLGSIYPGTYILYRKNPTTTWALVCLTKYESQCSIISENRILCSGSITEFCGQMCRRVGCGSDWAQVKARRELCRGGCCRRRVPFSLAAYPHSPSSSSPNHHMEWITTTSSQTHSS
jgi:hypothetical protein